MKVISVHNRYLNRGGEDAVFEAEARLLEQHGCEVRLVAEQMSSPNGLRKKLSVALNCIWSRHWHSEFRALLAKARPDVVHIHNFFPVISPSIYYACHEASVPVVQTLHNYRLLCPGATFHRDGHVCEECLVHSLWRGIQHGCYQSSAMATTALALMLQVHRQRHTWDRLVSRYIALSEFARRKFVEGGMPPEKISVKPNFVNPDPGERTGQGEYAFFAGRLVDLKGVPTMLSAWERLPIQVPLIIAGDGPFRPQLEDRLRQNRLTHISYRGSLCSKEIFALMKRACFLLFPSEAYENFPVTIGEASACGVPVVCSGHGSMQEIVGDGVTGIHFRPGDVDDLATKVHWAWTHTQEIAAMGRAARSEYEAKYTGERNYAMLMQIYQSAMDVYA